MGWGSAKQRCPQPKSKQPAGKLQGWLVVVVLLVACSLLYFTGGHNGQLFVLSSPKRWDELPTDRPARFFLLGGFPFWQVQCGTGIRNRRVSRDGVATATYSLSLVALFRGLNNMEGFEKSRMRKPTTDAAW